MKSKKILAISILFIFVALCILSFWHFNVIFSLTDSVILITIDTLRADHLGCYGYPRETSPFIDSLARKGILFKNAYSSSSHTAPSHASIFTSLYPSQHRVLRNWEKISPQIVTLADILKKEGFMTAGFSSVGFLEGVKNGFDYFNINRSEHVHYRQAEDTVDEVIRWIKKIKKHNNYLLWIHFFDPHHPYRAPNKYAEAMRNQAEDGSKYKMRINKYDAEISYVDNEIKRLYEYVNQNKMGRKMLWIITADHGEGLGDHQYNGHDKYLYNEMLQVPLIFFLDNKYSKNKVVNSLVRSVDIMPTLCDIFGIKLDDKTNSMEGYSLMSLIRGLGMKQIPDYSYSERRPADDPVFTKGWEKGDIYSLQDLEYKYIFHSMGKDEYYNLINDPKELNNIIEYQSIQKDEMRTNLIKMHKEYVYDGDKIRVENIDEEHLDELKSLGYL